jgi:Ser/Thr protein kinase RdoA (MazF antagonist)
MAARTGSSGPVPFVTHGVVLDEGTVVKRFRHWARQEPRREWQALTLLARYAPGLAPEPVRADLMADPPEVIMSRLPGEPLGTRAATDAQVDAMAAALNRLHHAIPATVLDAVGEVGYGGMPRFVSDRMRELAADCQAGSLDPLPRQAFDRALAWLDRDGAAKVDPAPLRPVYVHGDGNLANRLWDGKEVRLVDFEDSGRGGRAQELADFVEHITVWAHASIEAGAFLDRFDLTPAERQQISGLRRLHAAHWLMILLPSGDAHHRNPPGTLQRQASRTLELLA